MQTSGFVYTVYAFVAIIILAAIATITYITTMQNRPSPENLAGLIKTATTNAAIYPKAMSTRGSLYDYLRTDGLKNADADDLALSNFYVMTANLGGFFTPYNKAAFCTEAIQYALQAGARCLIFDIWPNPASGADFGPILQARNNDDSIDPSDYSLDLLSALLTVQKEAFGNSANPANNDPLYLYFRFRGKPFANTFNGTADAISKSLEGYRLPFVYNSNDSNPLYSTPINEFLGKVIILSDRNGMLDGVRTRFADYVNNPIPPSNTSFTRVSIGTPAEVRNVAASSDALMTFQTKTSQMNILACAPLPEDTANSESNEWDWKGAQNAGIQLVGVNLWTMGDGLNAYLDPTMFGKYSFKIKPELSTEGFTSSMEGFASGVKLRYKIERVPPPTPVANLGYGNGTVTVK